MRKRPRSKQATRNLTVKGDTIIFERVIHGRRIRRSLETDDWKVAAERRDALEAKLGVSITPRAMVPTFAEEAASTLETMERHIQAGAETAVASTTARDYRRLLAERGPIVQRLGMYKLDAIDPPALRAWYEEAILDRSLKSKTGTNGLSAIERVLRHARNRGVLDPGHKPVTIFSEQLREESKTKKARAARDKGRRLAKEGVLSPDQVGALVDAAEMNSTEDYVVVLLAVECGLRRGEISALTWGCVHWGSGVEDPARAIEVRASNSSGLGVEDTKAGKFRRPHLSRRLYAALEKLYKARWKPSNDARIVKRHYSELGNVTLRRALRKAGLPDRSFQNLRATCSSLLKSWGIDPAYVRAAIGHEGEAVAAKHYDRLDFTTYREPERLGTGTCRRTCSRGFAVLRTPRSPPDSKILLVISTS